MRKVITTGDLLAREDYAAYPIFSLHLDDADTLSSYRALLLGLGIHWTEVKLPGKKESEIGFAVSSRDNYKILTVLGNIVGNEAQRQFLAWSNIPHLNKLPAETDVPDWCYFRLGDGGESRISFDESTASSQIALNVLTGEEAIAKIDRTAKTWATDRDISMWKHIALIPYLS